MEPTRTEMKHTHSSEGSVDINTPKIKKTAKRLTGAKRVIRTPELLAWCVILALVSDALEVVGVILEACTVG
jgi:hypothetical protein